MNTSFCFLISSPPPPSPFMWLAWFCVFIIRSHHLRYTNLSTSWMSFRALLTRLRAPMLRSFPQRWVGRSWDQHVSCQVPLILTSPITVSWSAWRQQRPWIQRFVGSIELYSFKQCLRMPLITLTHSFAIVQPKVEKSSGKHMQSAQNKYREFDEYLRARGYNTVSDESSNITLSYVHSLIGTFFFTSFLDSTLPMSTCFFIVFFPSWFSMIRCVFYWHLHFLLAWDCGLCEIGFVIISPVRLRQWRQRHWSMKLSLCE